MRWPKMVLAGWLVVLWTPPAHADSIIYSNLGPGSSFKGSAYGIGFVPGDDESDPLKDSNHFFWGMPFSQPNIARLRTVEVPILFHTLQFGPGELEISLYRSSLKTGLPLPGRLLETLTREFDSEGRLIIFRSTLNPLIRPDTTYFLTGTVTGLASGRWFISPQLGDYPVALRFDNEAWFGVPAPFIGAFRLSGDVAPIPEPATGLLLLGGGAAWCAASIRRRLPIRAPTRPGLQR